MEFTDAQLHRYARHIILPEVGGVGQERLLSARVLVVGAGGLGSPMLMYLAAAGVGTIGIVDDDRVELSNLQRQIVHATSRVGVPKPESAAATLAEINPEVRVVTHVARLTADNALALIGAYDVIADGSDNFATRYLVNDACYFAERTLVSAAMLRFDGQDRHIQGVPGRRQPMLSLPVPRGAAAGAHSVVLGGRNSRGARRHARLVPGDRGAEGDTGYRRQPVGLAAAL